MQLMLWNRLSWWLVSHQGQNGDAKGDLQAFQEWACWVENQAAVTTSLPCTPSMICPTGWDGCGTLSLLSIGLITVSSLLGHCVPTEKWGHSVPKEGQENSFTGVCRARSSDHILLGCSKDLSFPSGSSGVTGCPFHEDTTGQCSPCASLFCGCIQRMIQLRLCFLLSPPWVFGKAPVLTHVSQQQNIIV